MRAAFGGFTVSDNDRFDRLAPRVGRRCATKGRRSLGRGSCIANAEDRYNGTREIQYALLALDRIDVVIEELSAQKNRTNEAIHDDEANRVRCVSQLDAQPYLMANTKWVIVRVAERR